MASSSSINDQPAEVASKVLRRAQVSKMTRTLQNRLALATVKIQNGWDAIPLKAIEPQIEHELKLKRKRPTSSSNDAFSDTSSTTNETTILPGRYDSSPLTTPLFSDDLPRSAGSRTSKRSKANARFQQTAAPTGSFRRGQASHSRTQWRRNTRLTQSSPAINRTRSFVVSQPPSLSFVSEATVPDEDISLSHSEDDDSDLPLNSFSINARQVRSSPPRIPRTPSPDIAQSARMRGKNLAARNEEGADLLMYLATSPSPAAGHKSSRPSAMNPPSTPPQRTPLPSSMLSTPGGGSNFVGFGTPNMNFNFADYLNVTPSPAQAAFKRTPTTIRDTARRKLNFDNLTPQANTSSPDSMTRRKVNGLGMDLGGELVSSQ